MIYSNSALIEPQNLSKTSTSVERMRLPLENNAIPHPLYISFAWNYIPTYDIGTPELSLSEEKEILQNFAKNIINNSKDLDPKISKIITDNFWDLVK